MKDITRLGVRAGISDIKGRRAGNKRKTTTLFSQTTPWCDEDKLSLTFKFDDWCQTHGLPAEAAVADELTVIFIRNPMLLEPPFGPSQYKYEEGTWYLNEGHFTDAMGRSVRHDYVNGHGVDYYAFEAKSGNKGDKKQWFMDKDLMVEVFYTKKGSKGVWGEVFVKVWDRHLAPEED